MTTKQQLEEVLDDFKAFELSRLEALAKLEKILDEVRIEVIESQLLMHYSDEENRDRIRLIKKGRDD